MRLAACELLMYASMKTRAMRAKAKKMDTSIASKELSATLAKAHLINEQGELSPFESDPRPHLLWLRSLLLLWRHGVRRRRHRLRFWCASLTIIPLCVLPRPGQDRPPLGGVVSAHLDPYQPPGSLLCLLMLDLVLLATW